MVSCQRATLSAVPLAALGLLGTLVLSPFALAHESAKLSPPDDSSSARGEARIGGEEIEVRGDGLPAKIDLTVWIADVAGTLAQAYTSGTDSNGSFKVEDHLEKTRDLAGRAVEVRGPEGAVLLAGQFPRAAARAESGQGFGELFPPAGGPSEGWIKVKAKDGRHSITIKVRRGLGYYQTYKVCILSPSGESEVLGIITGKGGGGGAVKIDTADGGSLPFGAAGIADLVGYDLQVKDNAGVVVLVGKIPAIGQSGDHPEELEQEVEFDLSRPAGSPDDDIEGDVNIEEEIGSDDKVRVRIKDNGDPNATYTVTAFRPHSASALPFAASLDGASEVPPVETSAAGSALFSYNSTTRELTYRVEFEGLSAPESGAHIHRGPVGEDGDVIIPLPAGSPKEGTVTLTAEQAADLLAGLLYVNVHSETQGGGEIRGQILAVAPTRFEIGTVRTDDRGRGEMLVRGNGVFPLGAKSLSELGGVIFEVANAGGAVVLSGVTPQVGPIPSPPPEPVERFKLVVTLSRPDPAVDPNANGKLELEEEDDEHEIEVEVEDLDAGASYRVELRSPSGEAEVLAEGPADSFGDLRQKATLRGSERLPFGVASFRALDGYSVVVLDGNGAVILSAVIAIPSGAGGSLLDPVVFTMVGEYEAPFLRGDTNRDFSINLTDVVATLNVLFLGQRAPACEDSMDANDDGSIDIADPVSTLFYLFLGSVQLPYPGVVVSGFDQTGDGLSCRD